MSFKRDDDDPWLGALLNFPTVLHSRAFFDHEINAENLDRKSTRLNSSHLVISYAVFCLKKKKTCSHELKSRVCCLFNDVLAYLLSASTNILNDINPTLLL